MTTPAVTPNIPGLPPGSILKPLNAPAPAQAAPPPSAPAAAGGIEGLPPGSLLRPLRNETPSPWGPRTTIKGLLSDAGKGIAQGAANTVGSSVAGTARAIHGLGKMLEYGGGSPGASGIGRFLQSITPEEGIQSLEARTQDRSTPDPDHPLQSVAKTAEQAGEFMLPGAGEEEALAHVAPYLTKLGRLGKPLARIGYQGVTSALSNASQGGSPTTGAAAGVVGGTLGEGLRAAAPAVAESALGITKRMRGYGKTPGLAALEDTTGLTAGKVEASAQKKLGDLTSNVQSMASSHPGPVSIQPAIDTIDKEIAQATRENNAQAVEQLGRVRDAITKDITTGTPLPVNQSAENALNLKRGVRKQFVKNWNPELMEGTRASAARASGAIDSSLDSALGPEFAQTNQRISSLIPVAERSESLVRDPGMAQKIGNRLAAHTGALASSAAGTALGYREGGVPGAVKGGLTGLILPEVLASPTARMFLARRMYNPGALIKLLTGAGLQFDRFPSGEQAQQE